MKNVISNLFVTSYNGLMIKYYIFYLSFMFNSTALTNSAILMTKLLISFLKDPTGGGKWPAEGADIQEL